MGERDYVFISQELHFGSPEQLPVHLANFRIILSSVLTVELENLEAQMLSVSGKFYSLLYSAWRRKWQPTPVFLPGESQGRGSLVGCIVQSMGSHRVRHDWSDLAAAAAYSAWQRFKTLINCSFLYSCNKYLLIIYYVPFTGITEVNAQSGRQAQCISTFVMPQPIVKITSYDITLTYYHANWASSFSTLPKAYFFYPCLVLILGPQKSH